MQLKEYKISVHRLANFFKMSRDRWKQRAEEKQQRIRTLLIKNRDLSNSRDKWKKKAKDLEEEVSRLSKENSVKKNDEIIGTQNQASIIEDSALYIPIGHIYPIYIIQIAMQLYTYSLSSLRGCEKTFEIFSQLFKIPVPSFDSIRMWIYRLGLYELQRTHEVRSDWIFILDHTIELGKVKCLVILGVPVARLEDIGYSLKHEDVEVLDIEIMERSTGDMIYHKLGSLSEQVGTPVQIISDHGSDLKKGITLFLEEHSDVIYTYDITHKMASLLKKELENDSKYNEFADQVATSLRQIRQTELYFLAPPKQRTKARYLNIDSYVTWAMSVLDYKNRGDFSQICNFSNLDSKQNHILQSIGEKQTYINSDTTIPQLNDMGKKRFMEKLEWLNNYEEEIKVWFEIVELILLAEKQVKCEGLSQQSEDLFKEKSKKTGVNNKRVQNFKKQIIEHLFEEGRKIPDGQTLIGTSDIIESTFGKYKIFSSRNPLKEVGKMILTIPVFIGKKSNSYVKSALEVIKSVSVKNWANDVFGQSNLSKRIQAFNPNSETQN
jgi:hypothetical protein